MLKLITFLITFSSFSLMAQDSHDQLIQKFIEQRREMMEQMMKAFDDDDFFNDEDFGGDKVFDQLKKHGIGGFGTFKTTGNNVAVEEKMNDDGSIDVIITPKTENINLDIQTKENSITIKSETRVEEKNEDQMGSSQVFSSSSFSSSVRIPDGYTAQNPKQVDKSIVITLVPDKENKLLKDKDGRVPLKKRKGDKVI